jgi:hypothetical protein
MEIAITSRVHGLFEFPSRAEAFPVVEYVEDGSVKATGKLQPVTDENPCAIPITTIQNILHETVIKKLLSKDVDFLPSLKRSCSMSFDNTVENVTDYEALSSIIKDYSEQLEDINIFFSFNKTELSNIFGVSRVTIYDWLSGKTTPTGDNAKKISSIHKLLCTIPNKGKPISRTYLRQNISKYDRSLMEIFISSQNIVEEYQGLHETIAAMIHHSEKTQERLIKLAKSKRPRDEVLDYNLKNIHL